jgi:omega-amidase
MFNCPYANASFGPYSEVLPGNGASYSSISARDSPSAHAMASLARKHGIYLVAGSVPERSERITDSKRLHPKSGLDHHLYNTCLVFDPAGNIVAKHRKLHLFDIDVPGKMTFFESDTLTAGSNPTIFDTPFARIGVGICYDMRFGEYAALLAEKGANMIM